MSRIAQINLRVRPSLKAKLEKLAKQDRRSLSSYVEKVLEDHVKARQASSKGVERNRPKLIRREAVDDEGFGNRYQELMPSIPNGDS